MNWPAEAIWEAVSPLLPGFTVEVLPELDSTNSELMRRARAAQLEPVLLVAQRQTAGRGRLGRQWHSAPGDALMFSFGLPLAPADWSGLSLAVGVAVAEALHPAICLKWPNDLWLGGRKMGGILIETALTGAPADAGGALDLRLGGGGDKRRFCVIGIGLNLAQPASAGLSTPPAWLGELWPGVDAGRALQKVAVPLVQALQAFERDGFAPFRARFNARDALAGRPVKLSDGTEGLARGAGETGALLVHTAAGVTAVTSAEVSVRPA